jgi:hypothetical protein
LVHIESVFTYEAYKTILRTRGKFLWREYYASILVERLRRSWLPLLPLAKDFGLEIIFISNTPKQYSKYVVNFLKNFNLLQYLTHKTIYSPTTKRTSTQQFLTTTYHVYQDNKSWMLWDSQKYPLKTIRNYFE